MLRRGLACYMVVAACGLAAAPAALATWAAQKMVLPQAATGQLNAVSCVTGQCIGVGGAINSAGQGISIAQKWTSGTTWSAQTVADPSGNVATELDSISCTAASNCTGLGYADASTTGNFSQTWNGSSWSTPAFIPTDSAGFSPDLSQISCWAAGSCVAVGNVGTSAAPPYDVPAVAVLSGGVWKTSALANPVSGAEEDYLTGVSCPASGAGKCMAVGYVQTFSEQVPFTELLTDSGGTLTNATKATATPAAYNGYAFLNAVSCTSASACVAVGYGEGASGSGNYATSWNGTSWASPVAVATANGSELPSISCTAATACVVVGSDQADQLSGTTWSELTPPDDVFDGVSCITSSSCMAVGAAVSAADPRAGSRKPPVGPATRLAAQRKALAQLRTTLARPTSTRSATVNAWRAVESATPPAGHTAAALWSGGTSSTAWKAQSTLSPSGAQASSVQRISCAGGKCLAVGGLGEDYYGTGPLAESGPTTWTIQSKVGAISGDETYLSDVSCFLVSTTPECMVLGQNDTSGSSFSQLATSGSPWTAGAAESFATPSGASSPTMQRISCLSATACTAVGYDYNSNSNAQAPLVEKWNGTAWSAVTTPGGSNLDDVQLTGISCASTSACDAVGVVTGSANYLAFALGWAGTTWSTQTMTFPSGAAGSYLSDVSCPVAGTCTAVGYWENSSNDNALAEGLASGKWTPETLNSSTFSGDTQAVSCADSTDCVAVGDGYGEARTAGAWGAPVVLPVPAGYFDFEPYMSGVYCSAASSCTAAGDVYQYLLVPLAEAYS